MNNSPKNLSETRSLNFSSLVDRSFPDLALLREAAEEAEQRQVTTRKLEMLDFVEQEGTSEEDIFAPGTLTLIMARKGSAEFERIRSMFEERGRSDERLVESVKAAYDQRQLLTMADAVNLMKKQADDRRSARWSIHTGVKSIRA